MTANNLGLAYLEQHDRQRAAAHYERARELFGEVGDAHGEHTAAANLACLYYDERDFARFLDEMRPVYDFCRRENSERNAAITLRGIALAEAELGRAAEAVADLLVALEVFGRPGLRLDAAMTLNALGEIYQRTGDTGPAAERFEQAVIAAERSGSGFEQARAHHRLGELAASGDDARRAREQWSLALDGYRRLGATQAAEVEALLDGLYRAVSDAAQVRRCRPGTHPSATGVTRYCTPMPHWTPQDQVSGSAASMRASAERVSKRHTEGSALRPDISAS